MRRGAIEDEYGVSVHAALVACEASCLDEGFRQRDFRFFIELFSNWTQATSGVRSVLVHNAQSQRMLNAWVSDGKAKTVGRKKPPRYRLTSVGLLHALEQLVMPSRLGRLEEFFLTFHIVHTYGERLKKMLFEQRLGLSPALRVGVTDLLDAQKLVQRQVERIDLEIKKLELRIDESKKTSSLSLSMRRSGSRFEEIVKEVSRRYPYELNSQKPLQELMAEIPETWRQWELEEGAARRAEELWNKTKELLVAFRKIVKGLE